MTVETSAVAPVLTASGPVVSRRISHKVFGMALFIGVEAMLFAGFISAFTIVKAVYPPGAWPPAGQPRLPVAATAGTTLMLLASGALLWMAGRRFSTSAQSARPWLAASTGLGALFVAIQGWEWANLIAQGLTLNSSPYGSFFYTIVGAHALHAVPAIVALVLSWWRLADGRLSANGFAAVRMFWYFVVLVWPVLYWKVYL